MIQPNDCGACVEAVTKNVKLVLDAEWVMGVDLKQHWTQEGHGLSVCGAEVRGGNRKMKTENKATHTPANARLIAAAPDLLEAAIIASTDLATMLQKNEYYLDGNVLCAMQAIREMLDRAIEKAVGK